MWYAKVDEILDVAIGPRQRLRRHVETLTGRRRGMMLLLRRRR